GPRGAPGSSRPPDAPVLPSRRAEPRRRALPCLGGLGLPVLGGGGRGQTVEQRPRGVGDLVHGAIERRLIRLGRLVEPADLAHELERGGAHLLVGGARREVVQGSDVPAHRRAPRWMVAGPRGRGPGRVQVWIGWFARAARGGLSSSTLFVGRRA